MAQNGISTATSSTPALTKILRRDLKLADAQAKRQSVTTSTWYRPLNVLNGTHQAYVNGAGGPTLETLSGSASPTVGHPWSTGTAVTTYGVEFRSFNGETGPGDVITTCNEGDAIWFDLYGTAIPILPDAYLQFSGVNIENQDVTLPGEGFPTSNLLDPIPLPGINGDIPPGPAGSPILINTDNLTEGNETLTLTWYINSTTVATSTSITIVDTSVSAPLEPPVQLITNSDFTDGTTGWTASGGFGTYSFTSGSQIAVNPDGDLQFSYVLRTLSRSVDVSSVINEASTLTAVVNIRHSDKNAGGYTQVDTYNFTVVYKNSSGGTVITKTSGTSNAPQEFTDITLTLNRSEIPSTFGTITSAAISITGIDTGYWNGNHGPIVNYVTLTAS